MNAIAQGLRGTWSACKHRWHDALYLVLALGILSWIIYDAAAVRLITYSPGSDYWEHTAVLRALMEDPLSPHHPQLGDFTPSPRFGPHFILIALLAKLGGLDPIGAMGLAAALNTALLLGGIYVFFRVYFRQRLAPLYGLVVWFFSWIDAPHYSNVYELRVLFSVAGYPSTAALAVTLFTFALTLTALRSERKPYLELILLSFAWAYVYVTHQLTAMMALAGGCLLAATEPRVLIARRVQVGATLLLGLVLAALWPYYPSVSMIVSGTASYVKGATQAKAQFYQPDVVFSVFGFATPGVLVLLYFLVKRVQLFLPLGALCMLAPYLYNGFVSPLPLGHRFLLLSAFFVQAAMVWLLLNLQRLLSPARRISERARQAMAGALAAACLIAMTGTGVSTAIDRFENTSKRYRGRTSPVVRYARAVGKIAGSGVVLATKEQSWPLPTFGPKIVALNHRNPLVRNAMESRRDAERFFSRRATNSERVEILNKYKVAHVLVRGRARRLKKFLHRRATRKRIPGGRWLYTLRRPAS